MFSQLRNAVEQLAQPIRDASSPENHSDTHARSGSLDIHAGRSTSPLSSSELAESTLSSLRKSLVSQRSGTPSSQGSSKAPSPAPADNARPRKSNLEERLRRATFAIGDASGSTTPARSSRVASPSPMSSDRKPMPAKVKEQSAYSTPLPASPMVTAASESVDELEQPSTLTLQEKEASPVEDTKDTSPTAPTDVDDDNSSKFPIQTPEEEDKSSEVTKEGTTEPEQLAQEETPSTTETEDPAIEETKSAEPDELSKSSDTKDEPKSAVLNEPSQSPDTEDDKYAPALLTEVVPPIEETTPSQDNPSLSNAETVLRDPVPATEEVDPPTQEIILTTDDVISPAEEGKEQQHSMPETPQVEDTSSNISSAVESSPEPEKLVEKPPISPPVVDNSAELESLQARLKQVEKRFSDVSTSFKRLQAEKLAADAVLQEVTPLESMKDVEGLREYFAQIKTKEQVFQEEVKRLNQKLELQDDRIEELRETHKLEAKSRSDEMNKLKIQLDETEALFQAAQRATSNVEENVEKHKAEIAQLQTEISKTKTIAKEEEEKRVKAISLLKTVRQKLVKAEKDKDDALREIASFKEREQGDKNKEQADRRNFQREIDNLIATHEQATANLRSQFNKDFTNMQERYKQEISALRGQFELEMTSTKSTHAKELGAKSSQIASLENSLNNVTRDKNSFFDQLQLRQAELESSQAHLESIQHQNTEFQFQLREANDRVALLKEECAELLREQETRARDPVSSADEVARMVSATEAKYELKLSELKRNMTILEKERHDSESDWSRKLKEKVKELEDLKRVLGSAAKSREADESAVANIKAELAQAQQTAKNLERQVSEIPLLREQINELSRSLKEQEKDLDLKVTVLEKQLEEAKTRETQMKQSNKTLREEMRKVQSSAALLERQRNPGVGYWGSSADPRTSNVSQPETPVRVASPTPSTATSSKNEEEVNLEYLRNVILQFLEHKEMRPNLVKVLSIILHFTPQETRRLIAKV